MDIRELRVEFEPHPKEERGPRMRPVKLSNLGVYQPPWKKAGFDHFVQWKETLPHAQPNYPTQACSGQLGNKPLYSLDLETPSPGIGPDEPE